MRAAKLTPELADTLSERTLAKLLPKGMDVLPMVASLRVALLLGAGASGTANVDDAVIKRVKAIITSTLEYWSKKSNVSLILISHSIALLSLLMNIIYLKYHLFITRYKKLQVDGWHKNELSISHNTGLSKVLKVKWSILFAASHEKYLRFIEARRLSHVALVYIITVEVMPFYIWMG